MPGYEEEVKEKAVVALTVSPSSELVGGALTAYKGLLDGGELLVGAVPVVGGFVAPIFRGYHGFKIRILGYVSDALIRFGTAVEDPLKGCYGYRGGESACKFPEEICKY